MPVKLVPRQTRVLVVDDEKTVRTFVGRVLRDAGCDVVLATNGAEALRLVQPGGRAFDLFVLDLLMPQMAGDELARHVRRIEPDARILYLTAYSDRLFAERAALWVNEAFVDKPVTTKGLLEAASLLLFGDTGRLVSAGPVIT